jgi:hypothetical protein
VEYLDEVGRTAMATNIFTLMVQDLMSPGLTVENFLDIAVMFNLAGYVRIKGPQVPRSKIIHAAGQLKDLAGRDYIVRSMKASDNRLLVMTIYERKDLPDRDFTYYNEATGHMCVKPRGEDLDIPSNRETMEQALSSALKFHSKEIRKARWEKTKKRFLG